jgi:hypothetical protein
VNNYRLGWPEAFKVLVMGPMASSTYSLELLPGTLAINTKKTFDPTWVSPVVGDFFSSCYWQVTLPVEPTLGQPGLTFKIWHSAIIDTPLYSADYAVGFPFGFYPQWRNGTLIRVNFLSPSIALNPDTFRWHIQAAGWNDYNP